MDGITKWLADQWQFIVTGVCSAIPGVWSLIYGYRRSHRLGKEKFEHETKYKWAHEKSTEVLVHTMKRSSKLIQKTSQCCEDYENGTACGQIKKEMTSGHDSLVTYYHEYEIYIPQTLSDAVRAYLDEMKTAVYSTNVCINGRGGTELANTHIDSLKECHKRVVQKIQKHLGIC